MSNPLTLLVPTASDVAALKPGDDVLDSFGHWSKVVRISYRGVDVKGAPFVGFDSQFGETSGSTLSGSYKVGELHRTVHSSGRFKSAELDRIETEMRAAGERMRVL